MYSEKSSTLHTKVTQSFFLTYTTILYVLNIIILHKRKSTFCMCRGFVQSRMIHSKWRGSLVYFPAHKAAVAQSPAHLLSLWLQCVLYGMMFYSSNKIKNYKH